MVRSRDVAVVAIYFESIANIQVTWIVLLFVTVERCVDWSAILWNSEDLSRCGRVRWQDFTWDVSDDLETRLILATVRSLATVWNWGVVMPLWILCSHAIVNVLDLFRFGDQGIVGGIWGWLVVINFLIWNSVKNRYALSCDAPHVWIVCCIIFVVAWGWNLVIRRLLLWANQGIKILLGVDIVSWLKCLSWHPFNPEVNVHLLHLFAEVETMTG